MKKLKQIEVRRHPNGKIHHGLLQYNNKTIHCCLGRSGITAQKKEGDGATPIGRFRLLCGFYRKDRLKNMTSALPFSKIKKDDGWCDSVNNPNYNALVKLPFDASHEVMTRKDRLYDVCVVLDYNINPKIRNRGSAIFFHQTSIEKKPTEGCVAIDPEEMHLILPLLDENTEMIIHP